MGIEGSLAAEERQRSLAALLKGEGRVDIARAAERLDVHPMTIRRDLKVLERDGSARLVRGGAVFVGTEEFTVRQSRALSAKRRIAEKLASVVSQHESVGFDASTTLLTLAESMPEVNNLLAVTYGIEAFHALSGRPGVRCVLSGGELDARTGSLVGPIAQRTIEGFSLSCCVISTSALNPEIGTMEPTMEEVEMKQALVRSSEMAILALDSSKLDQRSAVRSVTLARIAMIVTELDPGDERLEPYRDRVRLL